jgi:hypothetical protein
MNPMKIPRIWSATIQIGAAPAGRTAAGHCFRSRTKSVSTVGKQGQTSRIARDRHTVEERTTGIVDRNTRLMMTNYRIIIARVVVRM